jgi:DNA modification methylase
MIINACSLIALQFFPDNHFDSIITDPPYELGFMGKSWDATGIAYNVQLWREALRVLKPGGHLLAFSGSRTYHRMTCAIEDAGFEIRDQIMWLYGSGFPKSLDVSKAIDKVNGEVGRLHKFTAFMRTTGLTARLLNDLTGTAMGSHYLTDKTQPAIPTPALWSVIRPWCGEVPQWVDELVDRIEAEREIIGERKTGIGTGKGTTAIMGDGNRDITAPATDAARQWSGWGTALKPAHEPICVARKPLIGTVAANVLQYGTGALNIDASRVGDDIIKTAAKGQNESLAGRAGRDASGSHKWNGCAESEHVGRWPANVIHDGNVEFPNAKGQQGDLTGHNKTRGNGIYGDMAPAVDHIARIDSDTSAARFFYCAKASKSDRDEGNVHPTVKPTALMQYLCTLVTPPGGHILDPFAGSGSTGKAAKRSGFQFTGIERDPEYAAIAEARINT